MSDFVSKRTNPSQGFDYEELMAILKTEAKREIVEEKRFLNLVDYSLAQDWLDILEININLFVQDDVKQVMVMGNQIKELIGSKTMEKMSNGENLKILLNKIAQYLGEEDVLEKNDFIFVFGGKNMGRIQKAVELWKEGWAPKIWISGGHPIYQENEPEAEIFKKWAIENGVPEEAIFTETESITIADNIRRSLNLMDENNIVFNKMIIVISWYAQKRAWAAMEKYIPTDSKLININGNLEPENLVSREKWFETEYGINIIFNEFLKMKVNDCLVKNRLI